MKKSLALNHVAILCLIALQRGLFEDITEGIRAADVMVACVSDEVGLPECLCSYSPKYVFHKIYYYIIIDYIMYSYRYTDISIKYKNS